MNRPRAFSPPTVLASFAFAAFAAGCQLTAHSAEQATLGVPRPTSALEAVLSEPGPVTVETVIGADWEVTRAGLINLDHPKAVAAHLTDGKEPIYIAFHALHHPTRGLYLVDTGVERALRTDPDHAAIHGFIASYMDAERIKTRIDTKSWLEAQPAAPAGIFLTHLHLDHVSGMRDVPASTPIYVGPGETTERAFTNLFVSPVIDSALEGKGPLREWQFAADADGAFAGVIDIFGDTTLWAISVPGHTPGSTAYLARTPNGPVLLVGDACHTAWGWDNGVEPGTFSWDEEKSAESLARLERFVAKHPEIDVRLGHQARTQNAASKERAASPSGI